MDIYTDEKLDTYDVIQIFYSKEYKIFYSKEYKTYATVIDGQPVTVQVIPPQIPMRRGASPEFSFIHGGQVTHARSENPIADLESD